MNSSSEDARREKDMMKSRILDYAAASAIDDGNVYMTETKVKANINHKKLTSQEIDRQF
eukprot:CAMPEP_0118664118 /NCGR_PEP_ID=MMETSP0785-20121206/17822_1 /TAXON_ID=91992 /ORGANISM="Bolidomonas pacifica, Strain CCMP 1866" /LENGTH=58 /DNA_ID=CAMNT_0006557963 /DNA_START=1 /DNA_END=174 /DNA_ORIENTATION=+